MKENTNLDGILDKIQEMRGFFEIGDEVIPFLGDLFMFLKNIMPLMAQMNMSMEDSNRKLPTASDKILTATETTEMATHEIMDKLDKISHNVNLLMQKAGEEEKVILNNITGDVNDTIYALQFQDITSQQLEHANRILSAIHTKFSELFNAIDGVKLHTKMGDKVLSAIEGSIDKETKEKEKTEFDEKTKDIMRHETISQDDIDQLFS